MSISPEESESLRAKGEQSSNKYTRVQATSVVIVEIQRCFAKVLRNKGRFKGDLRHLNLLHRGNQYLHSGQRWVSWKKRSLKFWRRHLTRVQFIHTQTRNHQQESLWTSTMTAMHSQPTNTKYGFIDPVMALLSLLIFERMNSSKMKLQKMKMKTMNFIRSQDLIETLLHI